MHAILRFLLILAIPATIVLALLPAPPAIAGLEADPTKHAVGMGLVTFLGGAAFPRRSLWAILLVVALASGTLEFLQGVHPFTRDPDPADWLAGMIGAAIGAGLLATIRSTMLAGARSRRSRPRPNL
ncbi:hypothetical protein [Sphingomonas xanthus]|uniref:VanZ family protein n=1 Tax=Sphingomonas xanthus TaxID=2594473 RepID=A0A516IUC1_9SPHN|nr:hypothetical protein [Sphingomonas xanthus]QDP20434.1 hypothetical protein FMM02_11000 [Sphingomonas xanthus]